jgi:hypothetical protein
LDLWQRGNGVEEGKVWGEGFRQRFQLASPTFLQDIQDFQEYSS